MKPLGALYLLYVLVLTAFGAYVASLAMCTLFVGSGPSQHPLLSDIIYAGIYILLFVHGLMLHLRVPGAGLLGFPLLAIELILLLILHLLK